MFIVSEEWKAAYPGAAAGILVMHDVANPASHPEIDRLRTELESQLRSRFAGGDRSALAALQPIQAYNTYFKRYGKTYHVQLQLESVSRGSPPPTSPRSSKPCSLPNSRTCS